jgi:hypothetical protein
MADDGAHDFDFWLGSWEVRWGGDRTGRNRIRRILDDRVLLERDRFHWLWQLSEDGETRRTLWELAYSRLAE